MAIDAYVGLPGHGKSYGVVEHVIIPSVKEGRHVVTNIPLAVDLLMRDFGTESGAQITQLPLDWHETDNLSDLAPNGCVLVLDELWRRWPAGQTVKNARFDDQQLLAEHRHRVDDSGRSMRIVLVTQDLAQISAWVRILVESTYRVSKKSKKFYTVIIYAGYVTGARPPESAVLRRTGGRFKKDVFQYYSSATQSKTGDVGDESTADGRANILKSFGLISSVGGSFVLFFIGFFAVLSFFADDEPVPVEPEPVAEIVLPREVSQPVPEPKAKPAPKQLKHPEEPELSVLWRVAGYVKGDGQGTSRVVLHSSVTGSRFIPLSDCEFYPSGIDVYCDVDGERITPWSGQGAISKVYQSNSVRHSGT